MNGGCRIIQQTSPNLSAENLPAVPSAEKRCYRCYLLIRDAEYQQEPDGSVRHLNACPAGGRS